MTQNQQTLEKLFLDIRAAQHVMANKCLDFKTEIAGMAELDIGMLKVCHAYKQLSISADEVKALLEKIPNDMSELKVEKFSIYIRELTGCMVWAVAKNPLIATMIAKNPNIRNTTIPRMARKVGVTPPPSLASVSISRH